MVERRCAVLVDDHWTLVRVSSEPGRSPAVISRKVNEAVRGQPSSPSVLFTSIGPWPAFSVGESTQEESLQIILSSACLLLK